MTSAVLALLAATLLALFLGLADGAPAQKASPPPPVPAYYLTAASPTDLSRQAEDIGRKFAKEQPPGDSILVLDFGAARRQGDDYGTALRGGTFFTNGEIGGALEAAAKGLNEAHRRGSVTIVYTNSNADLGNPEGGNDYVPFTEDMAREAGEEQAKTAQAVNTFSNQEVAVGGDIEPGLQGTADPDVPIAMVEGAVDQGVNYYDVGTAPCGETDCFGKWTVKDLCSVVSGPGRRPMPEVYFPYQVTDWGHVAKGCNIDEFAGASSSGLGDLSPSGSWNALQKKSGADAGPLLVRFPG